MSEVKLVDSRVDNTSVNEKENLISVNILIRLTLWTKHP